MLSLSGQFWKDWQSGLPGPARSFTQCIQVYWYCFNAHMSLWRKAPLPYLPSIACLSFAAWTFPFPWGKSEVWRGGKVIKSPWLSFWLEEIQLLKSSYWNLSLLPFSNLGFCDRLWGFFYFFFFFSVNKACFLQCLHIRNVNAECWNQVNIHLV